MKKIMISLMMIVAAATTSFAKSNNTDVANAVKSVAERVKQAPSGTVYGVVDNTKRHITVATPFGKYTIEKKNGGISFMGMSAKLVSSKNGVYKVKTSLGNFTVNARKGTITKKNRNRLFTFLQGMVYRHRALNCSHGIEMWKYFSLGNGSVQCLFCPSG